MSQPPLTLEDLDRMAASIASAREAIIEDLAAKATIPEPERPIENPIAQLGRLRASTGVKEGFRGQTFEEYAGPLSRFAAPHEPPPSPGGAALPPPPSPQTPYFDRPLSFDTEPDLSKMVEVDRNISHLPVDDATWRDIMFRPGMAAAMMFVLHPVIEAASEGQYESLRRLVEDLTVWDRMTIVEQVALTDLFAWVESEVYRGEDSMIPPPLRANMQRAYENYSQGS